MNFLRDERPLRLRDMTCTSSRRKDGGGLWQCQYPGETDLPVQHLAEIIFGILFRVASAES